MKFFGKIDLYIDQPPKNGSAILLDNTAPRFIERLIEKIGGSPLSHAAIILYDTKNKPWVYEAYPPKVQKHTWEDYLEVVLPHLNTKSWTKRQDGLEVFAWQPKAKFSYVQLLNMKYTADKYLGYKYGLFINYLKDTKKMHCSEYVGIIYESAEIFVTDKNKETPSGIHRKLLESGY